MALCLTFFNVGCIPMIQYEAKDKELGRVKSELKKVKNDLGMCQVENRGLEEDLKKKPVPVASPISETELQEIKKRAFYEAEKKYKSGINSHK